MNKLQKNHQLILQHFDAKLCPKLAVLYGHKYLLPQGRQGDYFDQDLLNSLALAQTAFYVTDSIPDISGLMLAARYSRPTLFLERELGEILLKSKLPVDLQIDDIIQPQFPSMRIMLPKGLMTIYHQSFTESLMFIDISFMKEGQVLRYPLDISREIDLVAEKTFGANRPPSMVEFKGFSRPNDDAGICINGSSSVRLVSYGVTKPWNQGTLANLVNSYKDVPNDHVPEMDDKDFGLKAEHLALNILILLSAVPAEYEPDHVIRKAKPEGKRIISSLLQAKWIGDHLVRARKAGMVKGEVSSNSTGRTIPGHWVSPHWRRQPYGKGLAKRKLIWILPYQTGTKEEEN